MVTKVFSIRIGKEMTIPEIEEKIRVLRSNIILYISEVPPLEVQKTRLILALQKRFNYVHPTDEEIIEFLKNDKINYLDVAKDFKNWESGKDSTGGNYGFWTTIEKTDTIGLFIIVEHTTSDYTFCPACGRFSSHNNCDNYEIIDIRNITEEE